MYSLRKSKNLLFHFANRFKRKKSDLNASQKDQLQGLLIELQNSILAKDREKADQLARKLEQLAKQNLRKNGFQQARDFILALLFALIVAVGIRSMWFESYAIPSGSMRPTFKEKDALIVSKTDFGLNIPLQPGHFYFDPTLVQRNSVVIFTGANMDIRDVNTRYFYLFPGKKQYIKRILGKPGDTLYFYGGQIYGLDIEGNDITPELQREELKHIDHVPFIRFEGKVITQQYPLQGIFSPVVLEQMNEPVAKLYLTPTKQVKGEMLIPGIEDYGELWGIKNYAKARLLTRDQVKKHVDADVSTLIDAPLYLELTHNPSLNSLKLGRDLSNRYRPLLTKNTSIIPLNTDHLKTLFSNLYTARFVVKNGFASKWGSKSTNQLFLPQLSGVPNGTYEFYNGKAYKVGFQGISSELPEDHPLYHFDPKRLQLLFNLGIEFDTRFSPSTEHHFFYPVRYAYYRDKDLYVMGGRLLKETEPTLQEFVQSEIRKATDAQSHRPYLPFIDQGPPIKSDGSLNKELIKTYGLTIPPKKYLALGDNYAMSSDSRDFGFVPEDNLRGGPSFIYWPPGDRFGPPLQPTYRLLTLPHITIWSLVLLILIIWGIFRHHRRKLPLKF